MAVITKRPEFTVDGELLEFTDIQNIGQIILYPTGLAELKTELNRLVFERLQLVGVPVSYQKKLDETRIIVQSYRNLPIQGVVRFVSRGNGGSIYGSKIGSIFEVPKTEIWLKTLDGGQDSLLRLNRDPFLSQMNVYSPRGVLTSQPPIKLNELFPEETIEKYGDLVELVEFIHRIIFTAALALKKYLTTIYQLEDIKFEIGVLDSGEIVICDVITFHDWRVIRTLDRREFDLRPFLSGDIPSFPLTLRYKMLTEFLTN